MKSLNTIKKEIANEYRFKSFSSLLNNIHPSRMDNIIKEISVRYANELCKQRDREIFDLKESLREYLKSCRNIPISKQKSIYVKQDTIVINK